MTRMNEQNIPSGVYVVSFVCYKTRGGNWPSFLGKIYRDRLCALMTEWQRRTSSPVELIKHFVRSIIIMGRVHIHLYANNGISGCKEMENMVDAICTKSSFFALPERKGSYFS